VQEFVVDPVLSVEVRKVLGGETDVKVVHAECLERVLLGESHFEKLGDVPCGDPRGQGVGMVFVILAGPFPRQCHIGDDLGAFDDASGRGNDVVAGGG
jgi:hypothetical protein